MRDTDRDWRYIGEKEPYWGVLTHDRFKSQIIGEKQIEELYLSGEHDVQKFMSTFRRYFGHVFNPCSALDYGCGVGRLTIPMARKIDTVVGVDISTGILRLAADAAKEQGLSNAQFLKELPDCKFEWINSCIVFQHIPPTRGFGLIEKLLAKLDDRGFISLHVTVYIPPDIDSDPKEDDGLKISMYSYDMNRLVKLFYDAGITDLNMEMTDHDGHIGIILFGRKGLFMDIQRSDLYKASFYELLMAIRRKVLRKIKRIIRK